MSGRTMKLLKAAAWAMTMIHVNNEWATVTGKAKLSSPGYLREFIRQGNASRLKQAKKLWRESDHKQREAIRGSWTKLCRQPTAKGIPDEANQILVREATRHAPREGSIPRPVVAEGVVEVSDDACGDAYLSQARGAA